MRKSAVPVAILILLASSTGVAVAQSREELQQAIQQARDAAAQAQAAATAAEAALARLERQQTSARNASTSTASASTDQPQSGANDQSKAVATEAVPSGLFFTGNLDVGVRNLSSSDRTKNRTEVLNNLSSTSLIYFRGRKIFTNDVSAAFLLELDFNPASGSTATSSPGASAFQGTPFNAEEYVSVASKNFGEVKIGAPNSNLIVANFASQPMSTGLGSGYSTTFGRLGSSPVSGVVQFDGSAGAGRVYRHEKTVAYQTPALLGLKLGAEYSFLNDDSSTISANNNRYSEFSVQYNAGNLNAIFAHAKVAAGGHAAAGPAAAIGTAPTAVLPADTSVTWNFLAANWSIGPATIYGGYTTTVHDAPTPLEHSDSWNVAAKYAIGTHYELLANFIDRQSKLATTPDARLIGLGANYLFDKSANLFLRYESQHMNATAKVAPAHTDLLGVGARYQF